MIVSRSWTSNQALGPALLGGACLLILVLLALVLTRPKPSSTPLPPETTVTRGEQAEIDSKAWIDKDRERQARKAAEPKPADR